MILLVTHRKGFESNLFVEEFKRRGLPFFRLNQDEYPRELSCDIFIGDDNRVEFLRGNKIISSKEISVAFFQQGYIFEFSNLVGAAANLAKNDTSALFVDIWQFLDCHWISPPHVILESKKLKQLHVALKSGLTIPETMVSTEKQSIVNFSYKIGGELIFKSIDTQIIDIGDKSYASYTALLDKDKIDRMSEKQLSPVMIQKRIAKKFEIRVVYIEGFFFAAKIESQLDDSTSLDWRKNPLMAQEQISEFELPDDIKKKISLLMKSLKLGYGSIDLIVSKEDEYVFLEVNTTGSWYWIEKATGLPILTKFVDVLEGYL